MARVLTHFLPIVFVLTISLVTTVFPKRQCPKACRTYIVSEVDAKVSKAVRVSINTSFLLQFSP